jgi:hypothetical protein
MVVSGPRNWNHLEEARTTRGEKWYRYVYLLRLLQKTRNTLASPIFPSSVSCLCLPSAKSRQEPTASGGQDLQPGGVTNAILQNEAGQGKRMDLQSLQGQAQVMKVVQE